MKMNKAVIILSGGLDSTTLLYDLYAHTKDVYAITFNYGQRHDKEIEMSVRTCEKVGVEHTIVNLSNLGDILGNNALTGEIEMPEGHYKDESMKLTVVPNRNMIMLSIAIGYAINIGSNHVYYGAHAGDHAIYPDCRPKFVQAIQNVAELCHYDPVYVHAPYLYMGKDKIVARGLSLGVDFATTWTCYRGTKLACGKCGSCTERLEAFKLNDVEDPIEYED